MSSRTEKINAVLSRQIANVISFEMNDPRTSKVSVLRTETTNDLKYCKVFLSVFAEGDEKKEIFEAVKKASGFIRSTLAGKINLRIVPELIFVHDESIEYSIRLSKIIEDIKKK